jgi:hypothetical protein
MSTFSTSQGVGDGDIDISNDGSSRVFVGNYRDAIVEANTGQVFEIDLESGSVIEDHSPTGAVGVRAGWGLAYTEDNNLVIGSPSADFSTGDTTGRVDIFDLETGGQHFISSPFGADSGAFFGWAVAGNTRPDLAATPTPRFAASAPKFDGGELVRTYDIELDSTNTTLETFVTPVDGNDFGKKLALVGEKLFVAAIGNNTVFVYDVRNPSTPIYSLTETADSFARGIFATSDKLFVSAVEKVFVYDSSTGNQLHVINNPLPNSDGTGSGFGSAGSSSQSIWATDKYLVIGANLSKFNDGRQQGRVHIFNVNTYELLATLENPDPIDPSSGDAALGGNFGNSVAINNEYLVITARFNQEFGPTNTPQDFHGNVYIYEYT